MDDMVKRLRKCSAKACRCHIEAADEIERLEETIQFMNTDDKGKLREECRVRSIAIEGQKKRIAELEAALEIRKRGHTEVEQLVAKQVDQIADLEAELATANNQLSTKRPTSFGTYKWACGHEGPSVCKQCWDEKLAERDELRETADKLRRGYEGMREVRDEAREQIEHLTTSIVVKNGELAGQRERIAAIAVIVGCETWPALEQMGKDAASVPTALLLELSDAIEAAIPEPEE